MASQHCSHQKKPPNYLVNKNTTWVCFQSLISLFEIYIYIYIYLILKQWFWTELEEVVSVYQSNPKKYSLHTTRSWEFLGLDTKPKYPWSGGDLLSKAKYGEEVIVGVLDSGTYQFQFKLEFIYFWPRYCLTCENTTIIFVV